MHGNFFAIAGATLAMLIPLVVGAIRDKTFNWYFVIDSIGGAAAGALLVPGLTDIAATDPWWQQAGAGFLLALGAKFALRSVVSKPLQKSVENNQIVDAANDLAAAIPNLTRSEAQAMASQVKSAVKPQEVIDIVERMARPEKR